MTKLLALAALAAIVLIAAGFTGQRDVQCTAEPAGSVASLLQC